MRPHRFPPHPLQCTQHAPVTQSHRIRCLLWYMQNVSNDQERSMSMEPSKAPEKLVHASIYHPLRQHSTVQTTRWQGLAAWHGLLWHGQSKSQYRPTLPVLSACALTAPTCPHSLTCTCGSFYMPLHTPSVPWLAFYNAV